MNYPFTPKSSKFLLRGHFWAIPLKNGKFGAGCVVGKQLVGGKESGRGFIVGVIRWVGFDPPTESDLLRRKVFDAGFAHIKTILTTGGEILGVADLDFGTLPTEASSPVFSTWGYSVARIVAEKYGAES